MNLLNTLTVNEKQEKKKKNTNEHDELEPDQAQVEDENCVSKTREWNVTSQVRTPLANELFSPVSIFFILLTINKSNTMHLTNFDGPFEFRLTIPGIRI